MSINELSPDIRDFLLNKNLILSDTVTDNGLTSFASGLGLPVDVQSISDSVQDLDNVSELSNQYRQDLTTLNQYISEDDMVQATIINNQFNYNQVNGGYLQENGDLNIGGPSTEALDVLTSITSQEGFSLGEGGFTPQNNIRTSITGRILGGIGAINDTPLGIIGGEQLLLAFKQKIAFNAQSELFGKINLQPFSLLRNGGKFLNPDYSITVSSTTGGRILDTALDLSGFELPLSKMDSGASIFNDTSLFQPEMVSRNNAMIKNTGKGQVLRLFESLNNNRFKPNYVFDRGNNNELVDEPLEYDPTGELITTNLSTNEVVQDFGDDLWSNEVLISGNEDSLLFKTKKLFQENKYNLYGRMFSIDGTQDLSRNNKLTTPNSSDGITDRWLSKGSGVLSESYLNGGSENVFCRTWDSKKSYDNVKALQKNEGLYGNKEFPNHYRKNEKQSVLDSNGFVKITPYNLPENANENNDSSYAKKFMFSIENLAWADKFTDLPEYEQGLGDPITNTKGRIMWFPPYDIKFSENSKVNWDITDFIGRGEPIYTYNNTVRSGNMSWKIIIDHPRYLNDINNSNINIDQVIASIAAGCSDYKSFFSPNEVDTIVNEFNKAKPVGSTIVVNSPVPPDDLTFYFPNDVGTIYDGYQITDSGLDHSSIPSESGFNSVGGTEYDNGDNTGLNDEWGGNSNRVSELREFLSNNPGYILVLNGYATARGSSDANQKLTDSRVESVRRWLFENLNLTATILTNSNGSDDSQTTSDTSQDSLNAIKERKVTVEFVYDAARDMALIEEAEVEKENIEIDKDIVAKIKQLTNNEVDYKDLYEAYYEATK